jgi:hypothetical protein
VNISVQIVPATFKPTGELTVAPIAAIKGEDGYQGLELMPVAFFITYRKLNADRLFLIEVIRFIRALLAPSAAVYVNEGVGVALYTNSGAVVED